MDKDYLTLKRASASRPSGEWSDEDYDVLADGVVVGRIMKAAAAPVGQSWMWTPAFGYHKDRTPTHGYEPTREADFHGMLNCNSMLFRQQSPQPSAQAR